MENLGETLEDKSLKQLFTEYYCQENGGAMPDEELISLLMELAAGLGEEEADEAAEIDD